MSKLIVVESNYDFQKITYRASLLYRLFKLKFHHIIISSIFFCSYNSKSQNLIGSYNFINLYQAKSSIYSILHNNSKFFEISVSKNTLDTVVFFDWDCQESLILGTKKVGKLSIYIKDSLFVISNIKVLSKAKFYTNIIPIKRTFKILKYNATEMSLFDLDFNVFQRVYVFKKVISKGK